MSSVASRSASLPCNSYRSTLRPCSFYQTRVLAEPKSVPVVVCHASGDADAAASTASSTNTLPIFPLGVVALPTADVPLQIFEARYRVLFSTLLAGEDGVIEGLVQEDSPFKGTKRFGMCFSDRNGLAKCGTILEIVNHECFEDGRILIATKGRERFAIEKVEQEKPVLLCKVRILEDKAEDAGALDEIAGEVRSLFRDVLRLNAKYKKTAVTDSDLNPSELDDLSPSALSFWTMSMMAEASQMQQQVLESDSPMARLTFIKKILEDTTKYLSAAVALESVMTPSDPGSLSPDIENPGKGGPD